ncbi:MAG: serine/threonine protein kinase [Myxococcales bacterium]|nr:serine/threonine protein kinase [Myxococcales bacterium]
MPKGETARKMLGSVLADTFRLERVIGEGGWGAVFEASHMRLRRRFAIKLLYPEVAAEPEALARFRREAMVTSELGHPHIVEVIDFNHTKEGSPYIVMELLQGEDLHDRLKREKRLPLVQVNRLLGQMASALQVAHESSVVHRDLKPRNVFLARIGHKVDVVKVLDFGISKVLDAATRLTTADAMVMGTPSYMAPEQAEGRAQDVSAASDIFALGAMVFKMLTGRPPFVAGSVPQLLDQILNRPAPKVHELVGGVPPEVSEVVDVALRKRPEERHPTVAVFQRAFRRAAGEAGEPGVQITEPPPTKHGFTPLPPFGAALRPAVARDGAAPVGSAYAPTAPTPIAQAATIPLESVDMQTASMQRQRFPDTLRSEPIEPQPPPMPEPTSSLSFAPAPAPASSSAPASSPALAPSPHSEEKATKQTMNEYGKYVKPKLLSRLLLVAVLVGLAALGGIAAYLAFKR